MHPEKQLNPGLSKACFRSSRHSRTNPTQWRGRSSDCPPRILKPPAYFATPSLRHENHPALLAAALKDINPSNIESKTPHVHSAEDIDPNDS